jgi:hypothetical protein
MTVCVEYDGWATAERVGEEVRWVQRDPKVHVAMELLDDPAAREFVEGAYRIGVPCPLLARTVHADLIETP